MTSPELLRFFHAEAEEYLDTLEDLASRSGSFEAGAFVGAARALRGSATMARVPRIAEIALVMERLANGVRDGEVNWTSDLRYALLDTITDLREFVGRIADWSSNDDRKALDRLGALRGRLPAGQQTPRTPQAAGTTPIFIALQAAAIAGDLETYVNDPSSHGLVNDVVNRLRSLRGIAGVADYPPLGEAADAVERTLRELAPDSVLRDTDTELLRAAAALFRRASSELRNRGRFDATAPEVDRFARAAAAVSAPAMSDAPVVRIEELFFTDAGPHLVGVARRRCAAPKPGSGKRWSRGPNICAGWWRKRATRPTRFRVNGCVATSGPTSPSWTNLLAALARSRWRRWSAKRRRTRRSRRASSTPSTMSRGSSRLPESTWPRWKAGWRLASGGVGRRRVHRQRPRLHRDIRSVSLRRRHAQAAPCAR